jgi:ribosomal protein S18 acetylase RimI-like enzyme
MEKIITSKENDITIRDMKKVCDLLQQLPSSPHHIPFQNIKKIMRSGSIVTLRDTSRDNLLIGMGTLLTVQKITLVYGIIQEVIVDEAYRGQGLGKILMKHLLQKGRDCNMHFIELTSKPERKQANYMYQSMGFKIKHTNVYRIPLP